eukprot:PhM_4_TR16589/c0_g1_i1/m.53255
MTSVLLPPRHCMCARSERAVQETSSYPPTLMPYVQIRVRHAYMCTSLRTLLQHPGSLLCDLFTPPISLPCVKGVLELDADPVGFAMMLDMLRDGAVTPGLDAGALSILADTCRTFGIPFVNPTPQIIPQQQQQQYEQPQPRVPSTSRQRSSSRKATIAPSTPTHERRARRPSSRRRVLSGPAPPIHPLVPEAVTVEVYHTKQVLWYQAVGYRVVAEHPMGIFMVTQCARECLRLLVLCGLQRQHDDILLREVEQEEERIRVVAAGVRSRDVPEREQEVGVDNTDAVPPAPAPPQSVALHVPSFQEAPEPPLTCGWLHLLVSS